MKGIQRDFEGKIVLPAGMVYIRAHQSMNRKGEGNRLIPKEMTVIEHYRKKKKKKQVKQSFFQKILSVFKR